MMASTLLSSTPDPSSSSASASSSAPGWNTSTAQEDALCAQDVYDPKRAILLLRAGQPITANIRQKLEAFGVPMAVTGEPLRCNTAQAAPANPQRVVATPPTPEDTPDPADTVTPAWTSASRRRIPLPNAPLLVVDANPVSNQRLIRLFTSAGLPERRLVVLPLWTLLEHALAQYHPPVVLLACVWQDDRQLNADWLQQVSQVARWAPQCRCILTEAVSPRNKPRFTRLQALAHHYQADFMAKPLSASQITDIIKSMASAAGP